jgi:hypothetical protein
VEQHLQFLQDIPEDRTPGLIVNALSNIVTWEMLLDEHWPDLVKIIKDDLPTWDRHCAIELYRLGEYMGTLKEVNTEFWEMYEQKLLDEGLIRYLEERYCASLLQTLALSGKGSATLFGALEAYVCKHHRVMDAEAVSWVIEALEVSGRGKQESLELFKNHDEANEAHRLLSYSSQGS